MFLLGKSGLMGVLLIGGALHYSGAGSWLWARVERLDSACFAGLAQMGAESNISNPICGTLARGIRALDGAGNTISRELNDLLPHNPFGDAKATFDGLSAGIQERVAAFSSSSETLTAMMRSGPRSGSAGSLQQQFQTSIDSFTIGQHLLNSEGNTAQGVAWLEQGAAQPDGMGVMSQLSLANLYGTGGHGVTADSNAAARYLREARRSISTLEGSGTSQSRQMIGALPMQPDALKQQIEAALVSLGQIAQ